MALDEERNSRTMKIGKSGEVVLPFGDNFDCGNMHISYDVKLTGGDDKSLMASMYANSTDSLDHQYDYTYFEAGGNQTHYMLNTGTAKNNIPMYAYNDSWRWMGQRVYSKDTFFTADTWHKVDIYVKQTPGATSVYYVYLDGERLYGYTYDGGSSSYADSVTMSSFSNNKFTENFTGLILRAYDGITTLGSDGSSTGAGEGAYLIDNVYAQTYTGASDSLSFTVDDITGSGVAASGGKLAVGFSEWLSAAPTAGNFTVTGPNGNVSGFTVENADNMQCVLNFGTLEPGIYTVAVSDLTGAISGQVASGQATFTVTSVNDPFTARYYLMDENFNDYTGGVYGTKSTDDNTDTPVGWEHSNRATFGVNHTYSKHWMLYNSFNYGERQWHSVKSSQRSEGDFALKMTRPTNQAWGSSIVYFFPKGVASGDFTLEFDVKHTNGGWGVSLVNYDNFESMYTQQAYTNMWADPYNVPSSDEKKTTAATKLDTRMNWSFLGMGLSGNAISPNLGFSTTLSDSKTDYKTVNDDDGQPAQVPVNTWTHIKAEIDTDSGVYTVTVTPEDGKVQTVQWTDDVRGRFEKGVMGLGLRNYINTDNVDNEVEFDNIQVYKENSYLLDQEFESYTVEATDLTTAYNAPGGWWKINEAGTSKSAPDKYVRTYKIAASTTGVTDSGTSGGRAMKLYNGVSLGSNIMMRAFSHAVNGGVPFAIEFDAKNSDANAGWQLHQLDQDDIMWLAGNNQTHGQEYGGRYSANESNRRLQGSNALLARGGDGVLRYASGSGNKLNITANTALSDISNTTAGTWYHYKVAVIPVSETSTKYVVYVNKTGDSDALEMAEFTTSRNSLTTPTAGIGFVKTGSASTTSDDAYVAFDNIKVYEVTEGTGEYGLTTYDAKTSYQNVSAVVEVNYRDGSTRTLTEGDVLSPWLAKRIAVHFSAPVALPQADEVEQPINYSMSSTTVKSEDSTTIANSPEAVRYQVYDTVEDVIALRRLCATMTDNIDDAALQGMTKYFSADRKTYYIEFSDDAPLTDGKDYVLMVNRNISFTNSTYATLDKDIRIQFAAVVPEDGDWKITDFTLKRLESEESGLWIDVRDLSKLTAGTKVKLVADGYNETKETQRIFLAYAGYKEDVGTGAQEIMNTLTLPQADIVPQSMYHWEQEINIESLADLDAFKGFIWDGGTMRPLADHIEIRK